MRDIKGHSGYTLRNLLRKPWMLLPAFALILLWACTSADLEGDQYLTWNLNKALADYDHVSITLVDAGNTDVILETVWDNKPLPDPAHFPKYKLGPAKGKHFIVMIRGYNDKGELIYAKDVEIVGTTPKDPKYVLPDLRLSSLTSPSAEMKPAFGRDTYAYAVEVPETTTTFTLKANAVDPVNTLAVNGQSAAWDLPIVLNLRSGPNVFALVVTDNQSRHSRPYEVSVSRGKVVSADSVTAVSLTEESLLLYTNDASTALNAKSTPEGAFLTWTSQNEDVVTVDAAGNVLPVNVGTTTVTVKAGNFTDQASVEVKKAGPILTVGETVAVKTNSEVEFPISAILTHATAVSFKHSYEGGEGWDTDDTTKVPETLKHTYTKAHPFEARFYLKDSRGNSVTVTRSIKVSDNATLLAIVSPTNGTFVNKAALTVTYDVNNIRLTKDVVLTEGPNNVVIDTAGVRDSVNVILDTKAPKAPEPTVSGTTARPTWSWALTGEGNGTFRIRLDNTDLSQAASIITRTFTPGTDLSPGEHILYVQERDAAGNWSESGKASITIAIADVTPPNAPKVSGATPTNLVPVWTWTSGGNGGAGHYRYKLDDSTMATGATETDLLTYTLTGKTPVNGTGYKLWVQERDAAGNWSASTGWSIVFDDTKPTITILTPQASGTYITKNGTQALTGSASSLNSTIAKVTYKYGGAAAVDAPVVNGNWSIPSLTLTEGAPVKLVISATDALGRTAVDAELNLWHDKTPPTEPGLVDKPAALVKSNASNWSWIAGTDASPGTGLSGKYRYNLNGGAWKDTTVSLLNGITLTEGNNIFSLQEEDKAGNWSNSVQHAVKLDMTGPDLKITTPANNPFAQSIAKITLSGTVSDANSTVASVSVSGQSAGAAAAVVTGGNWSSAQLTLKQGKNDLVVTATDALGNVSTAPLTVNVSVKNPSVNITYPLNNFITNLDTVTLKYTVDSGAVITSPTPCQLAAVTNTCSVTSPPNDVGNTGTASITVIKDVGLPLAPTVTPSGRSFVKADPAWNFTSAGDNAGGSGVTTSWYYKITNRVGGATVTSGYLTSATTASGSYTWTGAAEGDYIFYVQQSDKAGNWGAYNAGSNVVVDRSAPSVTLSAPTTGLVTSDSIVSLTCTIPENNPATTTVSQGLKLGLNTLTCSKMDSAGNETIRTSTVYFVRNTIFVKVGGTGDGTSWTAAKGSFQSAVQGATSGKQVWVAAGRYSTEPGLEGVKVPAGVALYGGFPAAGTAKSLSDRTFGANDTTYIQKGNTYEKIIQIEGTEAVAKQNITIDGFQFIQGPRAFGINMMYAKGITLKNLFFRQVSSGEGAGAGVSGYQADFTLDNATFTGFAHENNLVNASGATMSMTNCTFVGNTAFSTGGLPSHVVLDYSNKATLFNNKFLDKPPSNDGVNPGWTIRWGLFGPTGSMDITNCTFKGGSEPRELIENWDLRITYSGNAFNQ